MQTQQSAANTATVKRIMRRNQIQEQKKTLREKLVDVVNDSGYTYAELAARADITAQTLYNWNSGATENPRLQTAQKVLFFLGYKFDIVAD